MKRLAYSLLIIIIIIALVWLSPLKKLLLKDICLDAGGKWATNGNECIYQNCADDNSCKPSYQNAKICRTLNKNISKQELYFNLGMPYKQNGNVFIFDGGPNNPDITATIENNLVVDLNCGT